MKIRNPRVISFVAFIAAMVIRVWLFTTRVRTVTFDGQDHPIYASKNRFIYAFWHEAALAPIAKRGPKVQILVSQHADGELIAQVAQHLGAGAIRGSSTRGGSEALLQMIRYSSEAAHLLVTPDGPRGPRHKAKPGAVMVASQTGLPIIPVGIGFSSAWRAGSWDRFAVPKPFSALLGLFGEPMHIPPRLEREAMDEYTARLEVEMNRLQDLAEDWGERWRRGDRSAPSVAPTAGVEFLRKSA